ncbi:MAG: hypothetical protein M0R77_01230 [Gammaproteobacteria bacterium]|nr:hypothetical protein [Acholeplasmataceae bacterium]MCK9529179.1 hypothetical protein [Gammaproteobacteria bacterium]
MPQSTPYKGKSVDRVAALMNETNETEYVLNVDFTLGQMRIAAEAGGNTVLDYNSNVEGKLSSYVIYTRLPISVLNNRSDLDVVDIPTFPFTTHEVLDLINEALGLDLEPSEVINETHTTRLPDYPLKVNASSLAWLPSTYRFKALLPGSILEEDGSPLLTEYGTVFELESA